MMRFLREKIPYRKSAALRQLWAILTGKAGISLSPKKIVALCLTVTELLGCVLFDFPLTPRGEALDLSGYTLVFEDQFDGDTLDTDAWFYRGTKAYKCGYIAPGQVRVQNGNLAITGEYLTDGALGEGWYTGQIALREKYCRGYFEVRCICSKSTDYWSAFWLQADHPYDHDLSQGGIGGAELDIMEAGSADEFFPWAKNSIVTTIHCNGVDDDPEQIDTCRLGFFKGNNIYEQYNTYGMEWTDEEYIFYINGVETARSSFGKGVSQVPEWVILTLCLPDRIDQPTTYKTQFLVDYVRIYQK